jgi:hypothetical protein
MKRPDTWLAFSGKVNLISLALCISPAVFPRFALFNPT